MSNHLSPEFFQALVDFEQCNDRVRARLSKLHTTEDVLAFLTRYTSWNGHFANGVSSLTSLVGNARSIFVECGLPRAIADRSNFVASHFFDAARDEYDDHINPKRDSHRCLAQATLLGIAQSIPNGLNILGDDEPASLVAINQAVLQGYSGQLCDSTDPVERIFHAIGYHLGSELLADREFSIIDEYLRQAHPQLVQMLMRKTVQLAGADHRCYAWIGVHSGHGGAVEADHFDFAVQGAVQGLKFIPHDKVAAALNAMSVGFVAFESNHQLFFCTQ